MTNKKQHLDALGDLWTISTRTLGLGELFRSVSPEALFSESGCYGIGKILEAIVSGN